MKIVVTTQYRENYNPDHTPEFPNDCWKSKGCVQFEVDVDSDDILYLSESALEQILSDMVSERSSDIEIFEYVSHEVQYGDLLKLNSDEFKIRMNQHFLEMQT